MSKRRRSLLDAEIDDYEHIAPGLLDRVRVIRSDLLPRAADGLTLGRFVFLRSDHFERRGSTLMAHELVHVRQFAEMGLMRFISTYVGEYLVNLFRYRRHRAAYLAISLEIEARREAENWRRGRAHRSG